MYNFSQCRDVEAARDVDGTAIAVCFPHPWTSVWSSGVGCRLQIVSIVTIAIFMPAGRTQKHLCGWKGFLGKEEVYQVIYVSARLN